MPEEQRNAPTMKVTHTPRGFAFISFKDRYGQKCSLQKSSLATEDCVWLGCDEVQYHMGEALSPRMHLSIPLAKELIAHLQRFVDTGEISDGVQSEQA